MISHAPRKKTFKPGTRSTPPLAGHRYVALLRGINVGGKNLIKMGPLKAAFEAMGFDDVATYIASGNVLFRSGSAKGEALEKRIEASLSKAFAYEARVLVRSHAELRRVVAAAPADWPRRTDLRRNVVFLKKPLTAKAALAETDPRPGVDSATGGNGVLYFGTVKRALVRSGLPKLVSTKAYRLMTIRTYGTCDKILALMEA